MVKEELEKNATLQAELRVKEIQLNLIKTKGMINQILAALIALGFTVIADSYNISTGMADGTPVTQHSQQIHILVLEVGGICVSVKDPVIVLSLVNRIAEVPPSTSVHTNKTVGQTTVINRRENEGGQGQLRICPIFFCEILVD